MTGPATRSLLGRPNGSASSISCSSRRMTRPSSGYCASSRSNGSQLLAGDRVFVAVESPVVAHRDPVEPRAPLERRYRHTARLIAAPTLPTPCGYFLLTCVQFFHCAGITAFAAPPTVGDATATAARNAVRRTSGIIR
jgi:hypothetical protein